MKLVCSKCKTPVKNEFDELCHKCRYIFKNVRKHIIAKPHKYHIVRDVIVIFLILLLAYWAYNIYQTTQQNNKTPTSTLPEVQVTVPEINLPKQEITINQTITDPFDKNRPFVKGPTAEKYATLRKQQRP